MKDNVSGKPLIELLWMATQRGVIQKWSVDGRRVVLHRDAVKFAVPAIAAGSILRQLLLNQEGASMWTAYRRIKTPGLISSVSNERPEA